MKRIVIALIAGMLFGLGLALSGMTNPDKVLNFLDISGRWDPSLALVMGGALLVSVPGFAWTRARRVSFCRDDLSDTSSRKADGRLLLGSALFGMGWGIAGYCPGPALANLTQTAEAVIFVVAMLAGSQLARLLHRG